MDSLPPDPKTLAILVNSLPPHSVGGAEFQAADLAKELAKRGHKVTVFARAVPGDTPGRTHDHGVTWVRIPAFGLGALRPWIHWRRFLRAWKTHPFDPPDAILCFQSFIPGFLGTRVASKRSPLITWIQSSEELRFDRWKERFLTPYVLDRSDRVLVQTQRIADTLGAQIDRLGRPDRTQWMQKVQILGNGIELSPLASESRSGLLYAGRLVKIKAVDILLEALRRFETPPPLTILGDGPERPALERLAKGLPVTFRGIVGRTEVRAHMDRAAILVHSTRKEGLPNAVNQAMERGLPVVATAVDGIPDVITHEEHGLLVPPEDGEALYAAVNRLLNDKDLQERLATAARARVETWAWPQHVAKLEQVLESLKP